MEQNIEFKDFGRQFISIIDFSLEENLSKAYKDISNEISGKIQALRKAKKLLQDHLAKQVGISRQTLSKLEKGEIGKVSLQVFIKILEALDYEILIEEKKPFYYFDPKSVE